MLKIYNSLTRKEQVFKPMIDHQVNMYVCGITVYDYCHIGHARSMIIFDVVVRYLRDQGYHVTYVHNITDIDDKIIKRAAENHEPIDQLTRRFIDAQHEDEKVLGILAPDHEPRATEFITQMCQLIAELMRKGFAYQAENGDVCFNVRKFKEYGKLSGNTLEKLLSSQENLHTATHDKSDPIDFVLWKSAKPGEPHWPSPWGEGRPGWHIECSAMASDLLGQPFDIHGGGMDLKFPHHENEIAQSESAYDVEFAKIWMHVGLLKVEGEKMSKSLNNFITIRDAVAKHHPEELRFFMMNSHYRQPADYCPESLYEAKFRLDGLYRSLIDLPTPASEVGDTSDFRERFNNAMNDDFATTVALTILGDLASKINSLRDEGKIDQAAVLGKTLKHLGNILGILQHSPEDYFKGFRPE